MLYLDQVTQMQDAYLVYLPLRAFFWLLSSVFEYYIYSYPEKQEEKKKEKMS